MTHFRSFWALFGCFSASTDLRVAKIGTPTNLDIVILIFKLRFITLYTFSCLHGNIMGPVGPIVVRYENILHQPHEQLRVKKNLVSFDGYTRSLFWASATRLDYITKKTSISKICGLGIFVGMNELTLLDSRFVTVWLLTVILLQTLHTRRSSVISEAWVTRYRLYTGGQSSTVTAANKWSQHTRTS